MRISEIFGLGVTQHEIDFVDIDTDADMPLFLDPLFLSARRDAWSINASRTIRSFFQTFVRYATNDELARARALFDHLHEPNETCLGLSKGGPRGRAIGTDNAQKLFESILRSRAVETGVVEDLEDFRLFVPGIDKDKVSDMTTNIIRGHLLEYTKNQCVLWGIPMRPAMPTGFYWDRESSSWINGFDDALVVDDKRILLTPKAVVSFVKKYTADVYYRHFALTFLQHEHLSMGSSLVQHRKDGTPFVTKDSLRETVAPYSKEFLAGFTERHPEIFRDFRAWAKANSGSLSNADLTDSNPIVVAQFLAEQLRGLLPGSEGATQYHRLCTSILELLLYPKLTSPVVEQEIHQGRKRVDLVFDNSAESGFFFRVHNSYEIPAQFIFVECKNYNRELANPEVDQINGRFSVNAGKVGLLLFRNADDFERLVLRCRDIYLAQRHVILPLRDADLLDQLDSFGPGSVERVEVLLGDRFRSISL
jgi:hypothetical protein